MTDSVSLKKLGLTADSLDCPEGGYHVVPQVAVIAASARGGGTAACLNCKAIVRLERA